MAIDIATLGIEVRLNGLREGQEGLEKVGRSAARATDALNNTRRATDSLESGCRWATDALQSQSAVQAAMERSLTSFSAKLGGVAAGFLSLEKAVGFFKRAP